MRNIDIIDAKRVLNEIASSCIKYNNVINISTKDGNVIMLSEDDYRSLIESLYLAGIPGVYEDVEKVVNTPINEFVKEVPWK